MQVSLDLNHTLTISPLPKGPAPMTDCNTATTKSNGETNLFNLLHVHDAKQECVTVPPARWATFDCKNIKILFFFNAGFRIFEVGVIFMRNDKMDIEAKRCSSANRQLLLI